MPSSLPAKADNFFEISNSLSFNHLVSPQPQHNQLAANVLNETVLASAYNLNKIAQALISTMSYAITDVYMKIRVHTVKYTEVWEWAIWFQCNGHWAWRKLFKSSKLFQSYDPWNRQQRECQNLLIVWEWCSYYPLIIWNMSRSKASISVKVSQQIEHY